MIDNSSKRIKYSPGLRLIHKRFVGLTKHNPTYTNTNINTNTKPVGWVTLC